jgi:hypothetical protein
MSTLNQELVGALTAQLNEFETLLEQMKHDGQREYVSDLIGRLAQSDETALSDLAGKNFFGGMGSFVDFLPDRDPKVDKKSHPDIGLRYINCLRELFEILISHGIAVFWEERNRKYFKIPSVRFPDKTS